MLDAIHFPRGWHVLKYSEIIFIASRYNWSFVEDDKKLSSYLNKNKNKTNPKMHRNTINTMIQGDNDSESLISRFLRFHNPNSFTILVLNLFYFQLYFNAFHFLEVNNRKKKLRKFNLISDVFCFLMSDSVREQSLTENEKIKIFLL